MRRNPICNEAVLVLWDPFRACAYRVLVHLILCFQARRILWTEIPRSVGSYEGGNPLEGVPQSGEL
jgi:hypothetical protein